jgi:hypothetical protein
MILFGMVVQLVMIRPRRAKKMVAKAPPKRLDEEQPPEPKLQVISLKPVDK